MIDRLLPPERRRRRLSVLLAIALAVLVFLVVRASTTTYDPRGEQASQAARSAVLNRATAWTTQVLSYNAATSEKDIAAAKELMTEELQAEYESTLPRAADRASQAKSKVQVRARVSRLDGLSAQRRCPPAACAVGLISLTDDRASVLVFVNQYATASSTERTVLNPTWQVMRLIRDGGHWRIAGLEAP